ncbi:MAG TPA: hypothetical protein VES61_01035 [Gaiellaceae bacterium]|nr:hypothetical protein [Gaiellaceae bacterium]
MKNVRKRPHSTMLFFGLVAALATCLAVAAPAARAADPIVAFGPVTVANDTAKLSGNVGLSPATVADLMINGQPVGIGTDGRFTANVDLHGKAAVAVSFRNPVTGQVTNLSVPIADLAGLNLPRLPNTIDGGPVTFAGQVLNRDQLVGLKVNGVDVLDLVQPDGSLLVPLAEATKTITTVLTDRNGNTTTNTFRVLELSTTPLGTAISARTATGIRVSSMKYFKKGSQRTHQVKLKVVVRDQNGYLVRGLKVRTQSVPGGKLRAGKYTLRTGKAGRATFSLKPKARVFGKRLTMKASASNQLSKAQMKKSTRLPRRTGRH